MLSTQPSPCFLSLPQTTELLFGINRNVTHWRQRCRDALTAHALFSGSLQAFLLFWKRFSISNGNLFFFLMGWRSVGLAASPLAPTPPSSPDLCGSLSVSVHMSAEKTGRENCRWISSERQTRRLEHKNMLWLISNLRWSGAGGGRSALQIICNINSLCHVRW